MTFRKSLPDAFPFPIEPDRIAFFLLAAISESAGESTCLEIVSSRSPLRIDDRPARACGDAAAARQACQCMMAITGADRPSLRAA